MGIKTASAEIQKQNGTHSVAVFSNHLKSQILKMFHPYIYMHTCTKTTSCFISACVNGCKLYKQNVYQILFY